MKIFFTLFTVVLLAGTNAFAQQSTNNINVFSITRADSLFQQQRWKEARKEYEGALKLDSNKNKALAWNRLGFACYNLGDHAAALEHYKRSLDNKPAGPLLQTVHSRIARVYGLQNNAPLSLEHLEKAVAAGYLNLDELDTARAFNAIRKSEKFKELVEKAGINAFPCRAQAQVRQFDFWVGEWDVYATGTNFVVGHSLIQKAAGDCMLLENWTAKGGAPHNGKSMNYVNAQTGKWEQFWIGSAGGATKFFNGEYKDSVMRFESETTTAQGRQIGRFSFFNQGANQVRQLYEVSNNNGETWRVSYDFTYRRKK